jgi:hypothetical protein
MLSWALSMGQTARASVPRPNGSAYFEGIADGYAR